MAAIVLCELQDLYNLLNQRVTVSRLAEINYLCLIDAREAQDYNVSHIITAKHAKTNAKGVFLPFEYVEIDTMQNIVVYDSKTDCLNASSRAHQCAVMVAKSSLCQELETLRTYPVEIIRKKLFLGNQKQANCQTTMEDLKIKAAVSISAHHMLVLCSDVLRVEAGIEADEKELCLEKICDFIDSHINNGSRVLLVSTHGSRRSSTAATAYVMLHHKLGLKEAWSHVKKCKPSVVFDKRFTEQLLDWEKKVSNKPAVE